jgi:hypothetical protein
MASKLEKIRRDRLSEVDDILDLFQGKLGLDDILNQDFSLITDLANVRDKKNSDRLAQQQKSASKKDMVEHVTGVSSTKKKITKSSVSKTKKQSV